jgi:hypothetical protein
MLRKKRPLRKPIAPGSVVRVKAFAFSTLAEACGATLSDWVLQQNGWSGLHLAG